MVKPCFSEDAVRSNAFNEIRAQECAPRGGQALKFCAWMLIEPLAPSGILCPRDASKRGSNTTKGEDNNSRWPVLFSTADQLGVTTMKTTRQPSLTPGY